MHIQAIRAYETLIRSGQNGDRAAPDSDLGPFPRTEVLLSQVFSYGCFRNALDLQTNSKNEKGTTLSVRST